MSGHNKWSTIKHKKGAKDAKRGKIFSKLAKVIAVAVREGGEDEMYNAKLRIAIEKAKAASMPNDNIKRAIQKGAGVSEGEDYMEIFYEGYGPDGVAMIVECLTDNKNRTAANIRHLFSKHGGNLGENGCVGWMFDKKGYFTIEKSKTTEDKLMELVLDAGAEDIKSDDENVFEVVCEQDVFEDVKKVLDDNGIECESASVTMVPQNYVKLDESGAKKMLRLMDALEDDDDVNEVYANFDIDEKIMESMEN
ncbi:MAG: YebC/PmpR family DNA-binding transcriptional regulator [Candidatus Muiribacteriota bacterium]|jgi:YebC/PmpR family DNA-binding regulatory protein